MGIISRRDRNNERVDNPDYISSAATAQGLDEASRRSQALKDGRGNDIGPLGRRVVGRSYDAGDN